MSIFTFKVIIAGGRDFADYDLLKSTMNNLLKNIKDRIIIVSGAARGADQLGEKYANEMGYSIKRYPARWDLYGNAAGPIRNEEMAKYADALVAFWDGHSRGTKSMIELGERYGLKIRVKIYTK